MIEQALLQPCPDLPLVRVDEDGTGDPAELLLADVELAGQYRECQRLHQGLVDALNAGRYDQQKTGWNKRDTF